MRSADPRGFTLLEVLIASLLVMGILATTASITVRGVRLYNQWINARLESRLALFWKEMEGDLRNAAPSRLYPFRGDKDGLSLCRRVALPSGGAIPEMALIQVEYYLDAERRSLIRRTRRPGNALYPERTEERVIFDEVESLSFEYRDYKEEFPSDVDVTIVLNIKGSARLCARSFWLPAVRYHGTVSR